MATNNFKKLAEEAEKQYPHAPPEVEHELMGSMRVSHFVGNVVELYLPRFFDMILSLFGGEIMPLKPSPQEAEENIKSDSDDTPEGHPKSDG